MNRQRTAAVIGMAASLALVACEKVDSGDVATDAVYAELRATADGSGNTELYAALKTGGANSNTFLDLITGDELLGYQDTTAQVMGEQSLGNARWYTTAYAIDAADTPFRIAFLRTQTPEHNCNAVSAPQSNVTLPSPFNITGPAANTTFSRAADDVVVTWDTSGQADPMSWVMAGDCIEIRAGDINGDPGTLTIAANQFVALQDHETETCSVTISIRRIRGGTVDPNYGEGGEFLGRQLREIDVLSAP